MAIPASTIVSVTPGTLAPGGTGLLFAGMFLTKDTNVPIGAPMSFATAEAVGDFFGTASPEYAMATVYFQGFDTSSIKPALLWFSQYNTDAVPAYLRGGAVTDLDSVKAITSGSLSVTIDGVTASTSSLNLSSASSFSAAAALIKTALGLTGSATCSYISQHNAFVITSGTTGTASTISYAVTSAAATTLGFTAATGAVLSQGAAAQTSYSGFLDSLVGITSNWVSLATVFEPLTADKEAIATWVAAQGTRYVYVAWDTDSSILGTPSSYTGFGAWLATNEVSGTIPVYNDYYTAAFVCGAIASLNFEETNGRTTLMFRTNSQMPAAKVTTATTYSNLVANGYSAYCQFSVETSPNMLANGQISGSFEWADSYVNAIWIKMNLQASMVTLLQQQKSIPYDEAGYSLIRAAAMDTINSALNFGSIRPGVTPSSSQAAQMNAAAGTTIASTVGTQGWYLQVKSPSAAARAARQSPSITFWYMDGQSVQKIDILAVDVL